MTKDEMKSVKWNRTNKSHTKRQPKKTSFSNTCHRDTKTYIKEKNRNQLRNHLHKITNSNKKVAKIVERERSLV